MKCLPPVHQSTVVIDKHILRPDNFVTFMDEVDNIIQNNGSIYLYRGHQSAKWILDSTFVRYFKKEILRIPESANVNDYVKKSVEYNNVISWFYLFKFGILSRPNAELEELSESDGIDSWFELMKRMQQFPEEDHPEIKGTNIIDWTKSSDVALFFANNGRNGDGALWICDSSITGNTLQIIPIGQILDNMKDTLKEGKPWGSPLLFHPGRQIKNKRANNQQAVYFAQMDLRYSLNELWYMIEKERENDELIFIKLILPAGSENDFNDYLSEKCITSCFIYPDS